MDKMVIVIIDSGVYKNHSLFKNDIIEEYIYIQMKIILLKILTGRTMIYLAMVQQSIILFVNAKTLLVLLT